VSEGCVSFQRGGRKVRKEVSLLISGAVMKRRKEGEAESRGEVIESADKPIAKMVSSSNHPKQLM